MGDMDNLWNEFINYQNIKTGWLRVLSNMGGAGIDKVTLNDFQLNLEENLKYLIKILNDEQYEPLPLLKITIPKNNKERNISIPSIRDRVVQSSLLNILEPIFEDTFLDCNYGYRKNKSAIQALNKIQKYIKNGNIWVLDSDIDSFFDNVDISLLFNILKKYINDKKLLRLIQKILKSGEQYNGKGLPQGAVTSPLFANIYLNEFDREISNKYNLIRYADDFLILEKDENKISLAMKDVINVLEKLKLKINNEKTKILNINNESLIFLGYEINKNGRKPSSESIQLFIEKLHNEVYIKPKRERIIGIINGWRGYYQIDGLTLKEIKQKLELLEKSDNSLILKIILIATYIELGELDVAKDKILNLNVESNDIKIHKDIAIMAMELKLTNIAFEEFIKALKIKNDDPEILYYLGLIYLDKNRIETAIKFFQKAIDIDPNFSKAKFALSLAYRKINLNNLSKDILKDEIEINKNDLLKKELEILYENCDETIYKKWSTSDLKKFINIFSGREGVFATQWIDNRGKVGYLPQKGVIKEKDVLLHLKGEITLGIYISRIDNTVNFLVIDIDIKKSYLEKNITEDEFNNLEKIAHDFSFKIKNYAESLNIPMYIENSGYKGRHCWVFFSKPIKSIMAIKLAKILLERFTIPEEISVEIFPKNTNIKPNSLGSLVKLPFGIHKKTGKFSYFFDENNKPYYDQVEFINQIKRVSKEEILKIVENKQFVNFEIPENLKNLINKCNVLKYLYNKAKNEGELNHQERLVILYTFGHLNEEGKNFIHYIMSKCNNYDFKYTQKWINKLDKFKNPISCVKIREWLNYITPSVGCYCDFNLKQNQYPTPILHINPEFSKDSNNIKTNLLNEEVIMNKDYYEKVNDLLKEYLESKKEKRLIEEKIKNLEDEIIGIFEKEKVDSIETEYGKLRIIKENNKNYLIIEL